MKRLICLAVSLCAFSIASRAQYYKLELKLLEGNTYYQNSNTKASFTQTYSQQTYTTNTIINTKVAFKVIAKHDSIYEMEAHYQSMLFRMLLPDIVYNSDQPLPQNPGSRILAAFRNQPFKVMMSKSGNLISVSGINAIIDKLIDTYPDIAADQKARIKSMLHQSFGEQAFRSNFELGTPVFPAIPVHKNVLWTIESQLSSVTPAIVHSIYELRDIQEAFYHIHANSNIVYPNRDAFIQTNGVMVKYNLSGNMSADMAIDRATGWVKQSTIFQNITGRTEVKHDAKSMNITVTPMTMTSNVTITDSH